MAWFRKPERKLKATDRRDLPSEIFDKCASCGEILYRARLVQNDYVCLHCGHHMQISVEEYLRLLLDGEWEELSSELRSADPLHFVDLKPYPERLAAAERKTRSGDAVRTVLGRLDEIPVGLAVMDFAFIGGSMGSVVGERVARLGRVCLDRREPLLIVSASGGARMQEGILSLMQMPRTTIAVQKLREARLPYIVVLTDPTTGGVTASYAMLGDIHIAEPGALICFAGPRVIQQTIREQLPEGFQRAEYLLEHGMIDMVVHRHNLRATLANLCRLLAAGGVATRTGAAAERAGHLNGSAVDGRTIETLARASDVIDAEPVEEAQGVESRSAEQRDGDGKTRPPAGDTMHN